MDRFFTSPWRLSIFDSLPKRKGRPPRGLEELLRTRAWYKAVEVASGSANPFQVAQRFFCEDSGLWHRYEKGEVSPTTYLALAEQAYPSTRAIYEDGPEGLWRVLFGRAVDCWTFATTLDDDGAEYVGQSIPFEACVVRMCRLHAYGIGHGVDYEFGDLLRVIAMFRLYHEVSKLALLESDGLYEIIWMMICAYPQTYAVLERFGIADDVMCLIAAMQMERIALDPRLKLALSEWHGEGDVALQYVCSPLEVVTSLPQLRQAHAYYLDAMPSILSSFDTKSSVRRCV